MLDTLEALRTFGPGEVAIGALAKIAPEEHAELQRQLAERRRGIPRIPETIDLPLLGPARVPLYGGAPVHEAIGEIGGLLMMGPLALGMGAGGKGLQRGEPVPEAVARGVGTGLGAYVAGRGLAKAHGALAHPGRKATAAFAEEFPGLPLPPGVRPVGMVEAWADLLRRKPPPTLAQPLPPPPGAEPGPGDAAFRPAEALRVHVRAGGKITEEAVRAATQYTGMGPVFGGVPVPGKPQLAMIRAMAKDVGKLAPKAVEKFVAAVETHGGDILKAAAAVGIERGVAQAISDAVAGLEEAPTAPVPPAPPKPTPTPPEAPRVAPAAPEAPPVAAEPPVREVLGAEKKPWEMTQEEWAKTAITIDKAAVYASGQVFTGQHHGEAFNKAQEAGAVVQDKEGKFVDAQTGESIFWTSAADLFTTTDGKVIDRLTADRLYGVNAIENVARQFTPHKVAVREALKEGRPVPPEVLADYPDLAGAAAEVPAPAEALEGIATLSDADLMRRYTQSGFIGKEFDAAAKEGEKRGLLWRDEKGHWQISKKGQPHWKVAADEYARGQRAPAKEPTAPAKPTPPAPPAKPPTPPKAPAAAAPEPEPAKVKEVRDLEAKLKRRDVKIVRMTESRAEAAKSGKAAIAYIKDVFKGELDEKGKQLQERLIKIAESVRPKTAERRLGRLRAAVQKAYEHFLHRESAGKAAEQLAFLRANVNRMDEPYRSAAQEFIGTYQKATPTEQTLGRLKSREDYLSRHPEMEALMPPSALKQLERLSKTPLRSLTQAELDDLSRTLDLLIALNETKLELKVGRRRRNFMKDLRTAVGQVQKAHAELPPAKRGKRNFAVWLLKDSNPDILRVTRMMGGDDGVLAEYMVRGLYEGERIDNHWQRQGLEPVVKFLEGKGFRWGSGKMRRALSKLVTVKLPTARGWESGRRVPSVTLTVDEVVKTVLDFEDPSTRGEIADAGYCWGTQPKGKLTRPGRNDEKLGFTDKDIDAFKDTLTESGWRGYADLLQQQFNNHERWAAQDAVKFRVTGQHLDETKNYCPRSRNLGRERRKVPEAWGEFMEFMLERGGPWQARTGSSAAVVGRPALAAYLEWLKFTSKAVGRTEAIRNGWLLVAHRDLRTEILRRFGQAAIDHLESHLKNITGSGMTKHSPLDRLISETTNRVASAAIRLRIFTSVLRQPLSTALVADVLGPKAVAKGTGAFLSHPQQTFDEVMANSDVFWMRQHAWRTATLAGALGEPEGPYPAISWMDKPLRAGDFYGIGTLWESVKIHLGPKASLDAAGRESERMVNEEAAAPTFSDTYMSELQRIARRTPWVKTFTLFRNLTNRIFNKVLGRVQDVIREPGNTKNWTALLKTLIVVGANTFVALALISAFGRYITSGGKKKPTARSLGLDTLEGALGTAYGLGDAFSTVRRMMDKGTSYGVGVRQMPVQQVAEGSLSAVYGLYEALDAFAAGDPKALEKLSRAGYRGTTALFYAMGLPVAPLSYLRGAALFARGEEAKKGAAGIDALVWKASGSGAGAAEAVAELKKRGIYLGKARTALRKVMQGKGLDRGERQKRLAAITAGWRGRSKQAA